MNTAPESVPPKKKRINWKEAAGMKFGRWTATTQPVEELATSKSVWCICICGKSKKVLKTNLVSGQSNSCGCARPPIRKTHGLTVGRKISKVSRAYLNMLNRCHGPEKIRQARYYGRGIKVCDRWRFGEGGKPGWELFAEDMGEPPTSKHSLDRTDNDGDYCPPNCKWSTPAEQSDNRECTAFITHKGERLTRGEWSRRTGVKSITLATRLSRGWDTHRALHTPTQIKGRSER